MGASGLQECCICCVLHTSVVLLGNSRTSAVFSLLLLLEIQQRNKVCLIQMNRLFIVICLCIIKISHCFVVTLDSYLFLFAYYSTMRFRFWKQLSKQDGKSFPGINVKVTSNPEGVAHQIFHFCHFHFSKTCLVELLHRRAFLC